MNLTDEAHRITDDDPVGPHGRSLTVLVLLTVVVGLFAVFWIWALFFASKESVNRIEDRGWAIRAQGICERASADRELLADYRRIDPDDPELLRERADIIDRSTDVVEDMLDQVVAVVPTDRKGREIVPQWEAEYRVYIGNRRDFAEVVRAGSYEPFREAQTSGIPISERLERFAGDNEMRACSPPRDL